ncbi:MULTISPECIES: cytochrome c3 family protein [Desulfosediminicola]|uniref:cytochrome c3 family protein n=1 Tax=Desulfosediminicola TaxID=2886823 RepID=UPI0010AC89D2|nr:cytochrome c3 family protein [Desulfosediminicola ganghwensis]
MKTRLKIVLIAACALFVAGSVFAGETLKQFGDTKGRSYHADLYDGESCDSCHNNAKPETFPADFACFECHDGDELVEATARPADEKWQNPHNNLHYGKDVPCMECHGEHQESKPLCAGCHSFEYPNYKQ